MQTPSHQLSRSLLLLGACAPLLAACAGLGGPDPRAADVRTPAGFTAEGGAALPWTALDRWWTLYNDPELTQLVETGLAANTDVRTALARLEEVRAQRASVIRALGPRGDLSGDAEVRQTEGLDDQDTGGGGQNPGFQFGQQTGASNSQSLSFGASQELDIFGRNREARRSINAEFLATRFAAESVRVAVAAQIADTLFLVRGTAVQLENARDTLRIANELSRITRIRAERGLAATSEFDRAETERANAEAEVARLEAGVRALQRALLTLTGAQMADISAAPVRAVLYDPPATPAALPGSLLVRRPDVREAQTRIESAAGNLRRARLALLPTFTLRPSLGLSRSESDFFTATNGFWALGAGLLVPVLDRGRLLAEVQVNDARAEQAVIAYERAVQNAVSEADQALTQLEGDRGRVRQLVTAEARARSALDAAQRGYQAGLTDLTGLLDSQRALRGARSALSQARTEALQRSVLAFRSLGGGWSPDAPALPNSTPAAVAAADAQRTPQ
jgi:NodT family efflux transporter outer membrane factor (OMF) lipoprotein